MRQIDLGLDSDKYRDVHHPLYVQDLAGLLSPCLARFPRLSALEVHAFTSCLSQEGKRVFVDTIASALRYVPLPNLTELEIRFPLAHDFGKLFDDDEASTARVPIEHVLKPLRHLTLSVTEWTDYIGQRHWPTNVSAENAALPNDRYAFHLSRLVQAAVNLESLAIFSTDNLKLDNFKFASPLRLRTLCLLSMSISSPKLVSLLQQCKDTIKHVDFTLVKLNSGKWQDLFVGFCKIPNLHFFAVHAVGYSETGSSSHLAECLLPEPDDPRDIETRNSRDYHALGNLQRQVNANRAAVGLPPISEYEFRHVEKESLESVMMEELGMEGDHSA
ncbi:hypothetical protein IMZ48_22580 [Candidatus Bathyarchaeota archaeon]|nr:hypothetical protein [Candidatus Bathyarchaeota archaeon]